MESCTSQAEVKWNIRHKSALAIINLKKKHKLHVLQQKICLFIFQILLSVNVDCWKFRVVYHYYEWLLLQLLCWSWWTNHKKIIISWYASTLICMCMCFCSPADFVSYLLSVVPDLFCCSRCVTLSSHLHRRMGKSHLWIIPLNTDYCSWKLQPSLTALSWLDLTAKSPTALLNGEPFAVFCKCHTVFNMSVWTPVLPRQPNVSERECSCVCVWLCGCACVSICVCVCKCSENGLSVRCEVLQASTLTAHTRVWVHTLLIRHSPTVFFEVSLCHSHTHVRTHTHTRTSIAASLSLSLSLMFL